MKFNKLTVSAQVNRPLADVWKRWNSPEDVVQWNAAHPSWHCPSSENDLRVGGKFSHRMEAKDGSFGFDFGGVYDKVVPEKEIVYTMSDGRQVQTTFQPEGEHTIITTTFDAENQNTLEMQQQGWQAILDNFKNYVELNS